MKNHVLLWLPQFCHGFVADSVEWFSSNILYIARLFVLHFNIMKIHLFIVWYIFSCTSIYFPLVLMSHCIHMIVTSLNALIFLGFGICHQSIGYFDLCDQYTTSAGNLQVSTDYLRLPARILSDLGRHIRILQKPTGYLLGQ